MKHFSILILLLIYSATAQGQSFEGKLTYSIDFQINEETSINPAFTKEMIIGKMKEKGEYYDELVIYFKGGNYIKEDNSAKGKRVVYKSAENILYLFQNEDDYVFLVDGSKPVNIDLFSDIMQHSINKTDSTKVIHGDTCKLVILSWGNLGDEYHWYSKDNIPIDFELYKNHNNDHLNKILAITKTYPMEITKSVGKLITITMTHKKIEEMELEDSMFEIPELKKSKKKGDKFAMKITGAEIMKIKK